MSIICGGVFIVIEVLKYFKVYNDIRIFIKVLSYMYVGFVVRFFFIYCWEGGIIVCILIWVVVVRCVVWCFIIWFFLNDMKR